MTILRPGKKRRDPLGTHECWNCDCQFVVQHADPLPQPDWQGDVMVICPDCGKGNIANKFVAAPPAP